MAKKDKAAAAAELTDIEKSALGEICDLISSSLAKAFGDKIGSDVGMSPSEIKTIDFDKAGEILTTPALVAQMNCAKGLDGQFFLYINGEGLPSVFDIAVPDDAKDVGADDEVILDEISSIISGAVYGAMSSFASSMGFSIECSVVDVVVMQDESGLEGLRFMYPEGNLLAASTVLTIKGVDIKAGYLLPLSLSGRLIELLLNEGDSTSNETVNSGVEQAGLPVSGNNGFDEDYLNEAPSIQELAQKRDVQPATFNALSLSGSTGEAVSNIALLLDVMLDASIELGKTQMTIEEILRLAKGSVIELDKLASEPVEFLVNGKVIARGEVVVIDDNFGIRITEILSARARLENL